MHSTIFALSSGGLPSGVAVIRLSGVLAFKVAKRMCGSLPISRHAQLVRYIDPDSHKVIDRGLVLVFPGPHSFTGEDVVEFHCHGGVASVAAMLDYLSDQDGCRIAEPGEFSRRAFENGKMDLTQLEGLSDLIAAQTESQRDLALRQSSGSLRIIYDKWRSDLIRSRALVEAELDFSDEDEVVGSVDNLVWGSVTNLIGDMEKHLFDQRRGEIVRNGFRIALVGSPNSGKSSLLNALTKRDVAIVTPHAGTTRDVIEVDLDIAGQLVVVIDTAGQRDTDDLIELEGIRRARIAADGANLKLWLLPIGQVLLDDIPSDFVIVRTMGDLLDSDIDPHLADSDALIVNAVTFDGVDPLLKFIKYGLQQQLLVSEQPLITRLRHRILLEEAITHLIEAQQVNKGLEFRSEYLRLASDCLGRLTGRIDVEDLLDVVFSEFCIGK